MVFEYGLALDVWILKTQVLYFDHTCPYASLCCEMTKNVEKFFLENNNDHKCESYKTINDMIVFKSTEQPNLFFQILLNGKID